MRIAAMDKGELMARDRYGMSGLEEEFELEMDTAEPGQSLEFLQELDEEWEVADEEFEGLDEELEGGEVVGSQFAERLYELSLREFESEAEVDDELRGVLDDMEREYFWGGLKKLAKRGLKGGLKRLVQHAGKLAPGLPITQLFNIATQLSRGQVKGALGALAKTGLSTALRAHPAGMAALSTLNTLGFKETEVAEENREAWDNYVQVAREAFEQLAANLDETTVTPAGANRQAANAMQAGLRSRRMQRTARGAGMGMGMQRRVVRLRRGQRLVVIVDD
jgi:hypothetical protein